MRIENGWSQEKPREMRVERVWRSIPAICGDDGCRLLPDIVDQIYSLFCASLLYIICRKSSFIILETITSSQHFAPSHHHRTVNRHKLTSHDGQVLQLLWWLLHQLLQPLGHLGPLGRSRRNHHLRLRHLLRILVSPPIFISISINSFFNNFFDKRNPPLTSTSLK